MNETKLRAGNRRFCRIKQSHSGIRVVYRH